MHSLPEEAARLKPGKIRCASCGGTGRSAVGPCWSCDGMCWIVPRENVEPEDRYLAMQGDSTLDVGFVLEDFVGQLQLTFSELQDEEIAVWRERKGGGMRVVCVLYPDATGETSVKWL
jgi:hypothetical protein